MKQISFRFFLLLNLQDAKLGPWECELQANKLGESNLISNNK